MSFTLGPSPMPEIGAQSTLKTNQAKTAEPQDVDPRLRQEAEGFEGLFLQKLMQAGRKASLGDDLLGGSGVERMQSMMDQELTQQATGAAGLGMADAIVRQFAPLVKKG